MQNWMRHLCSRVYSSKLLRLSPPQQASRYGDVHICEQIEPICVSLTWMAKNQHLPQKDERPITYATYEVVMCLCRKSL